MKNDKNNTLNFLSDVLEEFGTAQVLTTPSSLDRKKALEVAEELAMKPILKNLAILCATAFADVLHTQNLRGADYADDVNFPEKTISLLQGVLKGKDRDYFIDMFQQHLRLRG